MIPILPGTDSRPPVKIRSVALNGLFVLALFYTSYFARSILMPLTLAILFAFLLRPVVRLLGRIHVPSLAAAALVLASLLSVAGFGVGNLSEPALQWSEKAPETFREIGRKLEDMITSLRKATRTAEELREITGGGKGKSELTVRSGPGLTETLVAGMREFLAQGTVMLILLFFILASGDLFVVKLMKLYRSEREKRQVAEIVREVEHSISLYLVTVTVINFTEGVIIAFGMYLIGMPDPVLWGVMAALLIYIPYLGPLVGICIVTVVALVTLELKMALLAPAIYFSVETLQGQFLTPMILGARFAMNPVAIFVWLILWAAIWGVLGAVMAVPLLTILKIVSDRVEALRPVSEFLSD
jgi:predicted PurR-regulated permease PerM